MINGLIKIVGQENVFECEPMSVHTSFRIGGPAKVFAIVNSEDTLVKTIDYLEKANEKYFIIGNGSNLLVSDKGYDGVILKLAGEFDTVHIKENVIVAGSGALLSVTAKNAYEEGLSGMEFASGIPGSIGGAIMMNAGAYGGEMKDIVTAVRILWINDGKCEIETINGQDMKFGYRTSILKERQGIVLDVKLNLEKSDKDSIKSLMDELNSKRREKQPLEYPSAGSTFKRPEGYFAAKLIEDSGLKGYKVGYAMVSEKHAGFVINEGGARASEVKQVIDDVTAKVKEKFGIVLEREVILLGEF